MKEQSKSEDESEDISDQAAVAKLKDGRIGAAVASMGIAAAANADSAEASTSMETGTEMVEVA